MFGGVLMDTFHLHATATNSLDAATYDHPDQLRYEARYGNRKGKRRHEHRWVGEVASPYRQCATCGAEYLYEPVETE